MASASKICTGCRTEKPVSDFSKRGERNGIPLYRSRCKACQAKQARGWYSRNTKRANANRRRLLLQENFGLTPEEYDAMLESQGGVCATCGRPESAERDGKIMRLAVDHCHETGRIRGLLCHACNRSIGLFGEDTDLMERAIAYLEKHLARDH